MPILNRNFILRIFILVAITMVSLILISQFAPMSQDPAYHHFSDNRILAGIPNFWNVVSNVGFVVVGIIGLAIVLRLRATTSDKIIFLTLFLSIFLTGIGSAYYHLSPDNDRLVFDRIPMTLVFMSFLSSAIAKCINRWWGLLLLFPMLIIGIGSVLWWHYTEMQGVGDLRYYGLVQFLPMLLVPLIFLLFPSAESRKIWPQFGWIIGWYIVAKILEYFDGEILQIIHVMSGHSLKHIAASIATIYFINVFKHSTRLKA